MLNMERRTRRVARIDVSKMSARFSLFTRDIFPPQLLACHPRRGAPCSIQAVVLIVSRNSIIDVTRTIRHRANRLRRNDRFVGLEEREQKSDSPRNDLLFLPHSSRGPGKVEDVVFLQCQLSFNLDTVFASE